jgi:CHAD domain-containing protein
VVGGHLEVERKFDVDGAFTLPAAADLTGLPGVAAVDEPVEHLLRAGYFDTPDLRLFSARVTMRRRTGGTDAGWHLKLPADHGARRELHAPLGRSARKPPEALLAPVAGVLRGASVGPIATLDTRRVVTELRDADGRVLAELADDTVTATVLAAGADEPLEVQHWREVEVELVDGDETLLAAVATVLTAAGASPSARASKLGRAIAARVAPAPGTKRKGRPRAGDVVLAALRRDVEALQAADVLVRTDQPDAIHQVRVATRRLRALLAATRTVLDRGATDPVREELAWLGGELSTARDDEVALAHLRATVAAEPEELVLGPVAARLQQTALKAAEAGQAHALETLSDDRYLRLLDSLHALLDRPPLADRAGDRARPVLRAVLRKAARRMQKQLAAADRGADRDEVLHEVRKAAKRLRYTAEAVRGELGRPAKDVRRAAKRVQEALGNRQDTVVTREHCRRLAIAATAAGESAFTFGRLHALEEARAARAVFEFRELEADLRPALAAVAKKR